MPTSPSFPTVGEIARRLGEPLHRVEYVIRTRAIRPMGVAGNARVFGDEVVGQIADELQRIDSERTRGAADRYTPAAEPRGAIA